MAAEHRRPGGRRGFPAGRVVTALAVLMAVAAGCSSPSSDQEGAGRSANQVITRPELGFSMELPGSWMEDLEQTPGSVFYARSAPAGSWVRVFKADSTQTLEQSMVNLIEGLTSQGAQDFAQQPVDIGGVPGVRLDYRAADGPPGAGLVAHSSYRAKRDRTLFSLSLATSDAAAQQPVLDRIASSFRLL